MFPLPPNEAVVLADLYRLLGAREVEEGGGMDVAPPAVSPPSPAPYGIPQDSLFNDWRAAS